MPQSGRYVGPDLTVSDEPNRAAAVATKSDDHAITPFAAGDNNTAVSYTTHIGAADAIAAGLAKRLARVTAVGADPWAVPVVIVAMAAKADAEIGAAEVYVAAAMGAGCAAGSTPTSGDDSPNPALCWTRRTRPRGRGSRTVSGAR